MLRDAKGTVRVLGTAIEVQADFNGSRPRIGVPTLAIEPGHATPPASHPWGDLELNPSKGQRGVASLILFDAFIAGEMDAEGLRSYLARRH